MLLAEPGYSAFLAYFFRHGVTKTIFKSQKSLEIILKQIDAGLASY